jgi:hypothetical protein
MVSRIELKPLCKKKATKLRWPRKENYRASCWKDAAHNPNHRIAIGRTLAMKIERFAGHREARKRGLTTIMLIESLILLILY